MNNTIKIEKAIFGGHSLGKMNGKAIFIEGAIPGETVEIEIIKKNKDYDIARAINVIDESSYRIESKCPIYNLCGGCSYQHIEYRHELMLKKEIIMDSLIRTAGLSNDSIPAIETLCGDDSHYRSHGSIKCKNGKYGFFRENSNELIEFPENGCLLLDDRINNHVKNLKGKIKNHFKIAKDSSNNIYTSESNKKIVILEIENGIKFRRDINSFFQGNQFLRSKMLHKVKEYISSNKDQAILDLGCGVGFFTLFLAGECKSIKGIDIVRESINFAIKNKKENNVSNAFFVMKKFSDIHPEKDKADIILCDPPRAGLDKNSRYTINNISPEKIVYVSCNPTTFARDIKDFIKNGYRLNKLTFIDMFPRTKHIELISVLKK